MSSRVTSPSYGAPLKERDLAILQEVIETFLESGEPVSSLRLVKHDRHGLSAATIRNVLAMLEERGFLRQPHTSAGRIPTPAGYHLFIDTLMKAEGLSREVRAEIDYTLSGLSFEVDEMASEASRLLSRLSRQVALVLTPDFGGSTLRRIEFLALNRRRVLCVTVSDNGFVENKVFSVDEAMQREELVKISNYLTENFRGQTLLEIRKRLVEMIDDGGEGELDELGLLASRAARLARSGLSSDSGQELVLDGAESLLSQPELADIDRVRCLFETFSDRTRLVDLLNRCLEGPGVRVFIGEESDITSKLDFSLIVRGYHLGGRRIGTLGLFGPSRMEYQRLIPLVDYLGLRLSRALELTH